MSDLDLRTEETFLTKSSEESKEESSFALLVESISIINVCISMFLQMYQFKKNQSVKIK